MIIIFGGTTEGRLAVEVCEQAGTPYYYSTKGCMQDVEMHNGVRLSGGMSANDMISFCRKHSIKCIIDAAHPFAETLHSTIDCVGLPVIRMQRNFGTHREGVIYCKDYTDAINKLQASDIKCLLALSGANTIAKLKPYWQQHKTIFRILEREESKRIALDNNFDERNIIFYRKDLAIPDKAEEMRVMQAVGCDAIITKESGEMGGFNSKVDAAIALDISVFVVEHPQLPSSWTYVTGKHGLRRAIEHIVPKFFPLKTGLTTGACATAAAKAAAISVLTGECPEEVAFALPDGEVLTIPVEQVVPGIASVIKENNDDFDVTKGCRITAKVELVEADSSRPFVKFLQGEGVGRVTLPGLGIPVGEPAINPTPRRMITDELRLLTSQPMNVTISVEGGRELVKRTFNHKVGVVDGISIIGTSGIVHPLSNDAFVLSIRRELEVAWAIGKREIGLVAGMKSESALLSEKDIRCVHYGNFIGEALSIAHDIGFRNVTLAIMIGKAVKLAEGHHDTHSHKVSMNKDFLRSIATDLGIDATPIDGITMARELTALMPTSFFERITQLCLSHCRSVFPEGNIEIKLMHNA